jgi:tetratricopeptide (TPR) repeat protein
MKKGLLILLATVAAWSHASADALQQGVTAFHSRRWSEAMAAFIEVLRVDPQNKEAHTYLNLIVERMDDERRVRIQEDRLNLLVKASQRLEKGRMDPETLQQQITSSKGSLEKERQFRWQGMCNTAEIEMRLGRLYSANHIVLQVLQEEPTHNRAQQLLSDLQSTIHEALTADKLSDVERHVLEGYYAFGQADFAAAKAAWAKARTAAVERYGDQESSKELSRYLFKDHEAVAIARVDEENQLFVAQNLFRQGAGYFEKGEYQEALNHFRQVALINPEFPQLASVLVQSEIEVEKDRTRDLPDQKRQESSDAFAKGVAALAQGQYAESKKLFKHVLVLDPDHPQAQSYLAQIQTQKERRTDPVAAKQHYEAGLIAYAGGKLEEALREWRITLRLDPGYQKATQAISKATKELILSKELEG